MLQLRNFSVEFVTTLKHLMNLTFYILGLDSRAVIFYGSIAATHSTQSWIILIYFFTFFILDTKINRTTEIIELLHQYNQLFHFFFMLVTNWERINSKRFEFLSIWKHFRQMEKQWISTVLSYWRLIVFAIRINFNRNLKYFSTPNQSK